MIRINTELIVLICHYFYYRFCCFAYKDSQPNCNRVVIINKLLLFFLNKYLLQKATEQILIVLVDNMIHISINRTATHYLTNQNLTRLSKCAPNKRRLLGNSFYICVFKFKNATILKAFQITFKHIFTLSFHFQLALFKSLK